MNLGHKGTQILLTSEGGKLIRLDTHSLQHDVLYDHRGNDYLMGITWEDECLYFSGCTFLAAARIDAEEFKLIKTCTPFRANRGTYNRMMRFLWTQLDAHSRALPYSKPDLHQMNRYGSTLYVTATSWNEIWLFDLSLRLKRRITIQPETRDYYHLNNVFCDGSHFYVCLNRYDGRPGWGGYAKFDLEWNEIERKISGWELHAFSVIDGNIVQLCCFSWRSANLPNHPRTAGLMINGELVFEYDPQQYFCKDFSMDEEHVYIVGGRNTERHRRAEADGVLFILDRRYQLVETCVISGLGGLNGCRLRGTDYSKGVAPRRESSDITTHQTTLDRTIEQATVFVGNRS